MPTTGERVDGAMVLGIVQSAVAVVLELDPATVSAQTAFVDVDADSLALVEVAEIVEGELRARGVTSLHIPDADLEAMPTVGAAADFVLAQLTRSTR